MNMSSYIVVQLVPDSPVDGPTFGTYLDGLQLQVFDAYKKPETALSDFVYSSPLVLFQVPGLGLLSAVSITTSAPTEFDNGNYGKILTFDSTKGIPEGSFVFSPADVMMKSPTIAPASMLKVNAVTGDKGDSDRNIPPFSVQLSANLSNYVPAGTVVTFLARSPSIDPTTAAPFSFELTTNAFPTTIDGQLPATNSDPLRVLSFPDASGVTVGMAVSGSASTFITSRHHRRGRECRGQYAFSDDCDVIAGPIRFPKIR